MKYFFPFLCASLLGLSLAHGRTYFYSECTSVCDSQFTHSGAGSGIPGVNSSILQQSHEMLEQLMPTEEFSSFWKHLSEVLILNCCS